MPRKYRTSLSTQRPLTTQEAEARHANIARAYFNSTPTIGNLYNGAVNWLRSKSILQPEGTGLVTGAAPVPGRTIPVATRVESARKAYETARNSYAGARRVFNEGAGNIFDNSDDIDTAYNLSRMLDRARYNMLNRYKIYRRAIRNTARRKSK